MFELSDGLRYAYLYKYGGKYMDTDSWTLKNLVDLKNVAAWEDGNQIANGVMFFEKGNPFIEAVMENFTQLYVPGSRLSVGPPLVTSVHKTGTVDSSTYSILDTRVFYPTHWAQNHEPFLASQKQNIESAVNGSYALHLYTFFTRIYWSNVENGSFVHDILNGKICG